MKIVFTGPESSGKTTAAEWLSLQLDYPLVEEIAREYLENVILPYDEQHVREIGWLQLWEERLAERKYDNIICDTDLLTVIIWMEEKYGRADDYFYSEWENSQVDMYFLCFPDIPWEEDPLRENPFDRDRLYEIYKQRLIDFDKPLYELNGDFEQRKEQLLAALRTRDLI